MVLRFEGSLLLGLGEHGRGKVTLPLCAVLEHGGCVGEMVQYNKGISDCQLKEEKGREYWSVSVKVELCKWWAS